MKHFKFDFLNLENRVAMDCVAPFDEVTQPGTVITSPNYPGNYSNNMECQLTIRFAADEIVKITLDEFEVEEPENDYEYEDEYDSLCGFDDLTLYDGDTTSYRIIEELCGKHAGGKTFKSR